MNSIPATSPNSVTAGLLTRPQVAGQLNRTERTIIRYERAGMPFIRLGMMRLYEPEAVRAWIMQHEHRPSAPKRGRPRKHAA